MKIPFIRRSLKALSIFILFSAGVHVFVLTVYSLKASDLNYLNYFKILDLDLFFPSLGVGYGPFIVASSFVVIAILAIYLYKKK